ncbi:MAG: DNA methylase, partial [Muribaculaceae bacterium]|nr:DNA methylase [Muribaculaceae bacterium]
MDRKYVAIDLKSFYASVECVERGLDPLDTNLVVADRSRTEKTICLAVSPALKSVGLGGRPRLFEVVQKVRRVNRSRGRAGGSVSKRELDRRDDLQIDYIVAQPRMALYLDYSTRIYDVYMRFVAPEDVHVYSIDEVLVDVTAYLRSYGVTAHELAMQMIKAVLAETGITATAGVGSNLYLAKVAMDIVAKKMKPDRAGGRSAELDEITSRRQLWSHEPLTDFWRVGRGIARRLAERGIKTMGDLARASIEHEDSLYTMFGVNAELLIDHAWGWEPVTMDQVKAYRPEKRSMSSGQVLQEPYTAAKARIVAREMAESIALELVEKREVTDQLTLTIGYDTESLMREDIRAQYDGRISLDFYGREVPYHAHGTANLGRHLSSSRLIEGAIAELFDRIVNPILLIRRITISTNNIVDERSAAARISVASGAPKQLTLFDDAECEPELADDAERLARERRLQEAVVEIKSTYGKNAL